MYNRIFQYVNLFNLSHCKFSVNICWNVIRNFDCDVTCNASSVKLVKTIVRGKVMGANKEKA